MALLKSQTDREVSQTNEKKFNGLRRTQDGMLYLTSIDPNSEKAAIQVSNFFEEGKSDLLPKDGETDYTEERLELFNTQFFIGDNSTTGFILNANNIPTENLVVFKDNVLLTPFTDYQIIDTTLKMTIRPASGSNITVGQKKKRYKNNDSDRYQQFEYSDNTTTTYLINSSGDLVKRVNDGITRTAESSDTFDTFDSSQTVNSTTYQSAV